MSDYGSSATCDGDYVAATAQFRGSVTVGGATYNAIGGTDVFFFKLAPGNGVLLDVARFGSSGDDYIAVDRSAEGMLVGTGAFGGSGDFFGTNLNSAGADDVVVFSENF
jgi:hypothetical protein